MPRPDFSDYVVHFTKGLRPWGLTSGRDDLVQGLEGIAALGAAERLTQILDQRVIRATNMPWTHAPCVCFTECVWGSLLDHSRRYSRYGIGFHKKVLFERGGGPAVYIRQDLLAAQRDLVAVRRGWHSDLWPFLTPFVPAYASQEHLAAYWAGRGVPHCDYSDEREWRVPRDFDFALSDVAFLIVARYEDEAAMDRAVKNELGRQNILLMDNYSRVNELWPWHHY